MTGYLLGALAAAGVGLLFWGVTSRPRTEDEMELPRAIPLVPERAPREVRSLRETLSGPMSSMATPVLRGARGGALQVELSRAGLNLKAAEWVLLKFGLAALIGLLAAARFGNIFLLLIGAVVGYFLPNLYLGNRQRQRRQAFEGSLGDVIVILSNGIKAGYSIQQALVGVSESGRQPLSDEIGRVVRETSLGIDLPTALEHANARLNSKDFELVVTAVLIHRTVGGNLAEVLDKIAETVRERVRIQGEVRVLTAQARASGYIITVLPFAVALILSIVSPGFETPLFRNPLGWAMIAVGLVSISIGYAIIRRITDIHL